MKPAPESLPHLLKLLLELLTLLNVLGEHLVPLRVILGVGLVGEVLVLQQMSISR